ncbi:hypothetical protein [Streptomyces sp. T028]|uniref:hypothetical protein n=1 Tax=Streptomyces sp. T028 TaxID=3394379 RepID=UPI003A8718D4
MTMRVSTPDVLRRAATAAAVTSAAAAAVLGVPAYAVPAHAESGSPCAGSDAAAFPLTTRLHGGPDSYRAGGGYGSWYLDLTNTTDRTCAGIHPVVVLVDTGRTLKPGQPHLDFYAGADGDGNADGNGGGNGNGNGDGRPHPVRFETTDEDELVGAFTDGPEGEAGAFPGFTIAPHRTLTVKVRLALTSDTAPGDITANAALVQRHGDDGDWIGQSNDYRFAVETTEPRPTAPATETPTEAGTATETAPETAPETTSDASSSPRSSGAPSLADEAAELARSGLGSTAALLTATACFVAAGIALLLARRRN